ncbi:MAG TPA: hypothetical protein VGB85_01425 [Nannocystis sp.]
MFNGFAGASIAGSAGAYVFVGPFAVVTTTVSQRLTAAGTAPIALTVPGPQTAQLGLCYQNNANPGVLTNFVGGAYSIVQFTNIRISQAVAASVVPGAGTWRVGVCVQNNGGANALANNDYVNGWVQVTN